MKTNKKLLASAMALGLASLTTVGSTYAWFTTNGAAALNNIEMSATAGDGLFVSLTGGIYYESIDLSSVFNKNSGSTGDNAPAADYSKSPVTTLDGVNFRRLAANKWIDATGAVEDINTADITETENRFNYENAVAGTDYVEFNLYLAVTNGFSVAFDNDVTSFTGYNGNTAIDAATASIVDTARLSVANASTATPTSAEIYGLHTTAASRATDIALRDFNSLYGARIQTKSNGLPGYNGASKDGIFQPTSVDSQNGWTDVSQSSDILVTTATGSNGVIDAGVEITGGGYYYAKLTFRFWIEGNDVFCYNGISGQRFTGTIGLKTVSEAA